MVLPPDILDNIFCLLDVDVLRSCTAAPGTSMFATLAERHLYSAIDLSPCGPGNEDASSVTLNRQQLHDLIKGKPYVSGHIRRIRLVIKSEDAIAWLSGSETQDDNCKVPELPCLRALSMETGEAIGSNGLKWTSIPRSLRLYWEGLVQLPSIEEVSIQDIYDFPLIILDVARNVKHLMLDGGSHTFDRPTTTSLVQPVQITLRRDEINNIECFKWLYYAPEDISRISSLHTLYFQSNMKADFTILSQLLPSCSGTLEVLTIDIGEPANPSVTVHFSTQEIQVDSEKLKEIMRLDLSSLHKLKKLVIYTVTAVSHDIEQNLEELTFRALGIISSSTASVGDAIKSAAIGGSSSTLQEICIFLTFKSDSPGTPPISLANFDFGAMTDPLASLRSRFTQLSPPKLAIYSTRQQPYPDQLAALTKNPYLSPAVQEGCLDISLTDEEWNTAAVLCVASD